MTPLSALFDSALSQTQAPVREQAMSVGKANTEVITGRASEATSVGIFPLEVALVVVGCLIVSGFLLLMRESRIEKYQG